MTYGSESECATHYTTAFTCDFLTNEYRVYCRCPRLKASLKCHAKCVLISTMLLRWFMRALRLSAVLVAVPRRRASVAAPRHVEDPRPRRPAFTWQPDECIQSSCTSRQCQLLAPSKNSRLQATQQRRHCNRNCCFSCCSVEQE